jgi:hypothetical protein
VIFSCRVTISSFGEEEEGWVQVRGTNMEACLRG